MPPPRPQRRHKASAGLCHCNVIARGSPRTAEMAVLACATSFVSAPASAVNCKRQTIAEALRPSCSLLSTPLRRNAVRIGQSGRWRAAAHHCGILSSGPGSFPPLTVVIPLQSGATVRAAPDFAWRGRAKGGHMSQTQRLRRGTALFARGMPQLPLERSRCFCVFSAFCFFFAAGLRDGVDYNNAIVHCTLYSRRASGLKRGSNVARLGEGDAAGGGQRERPRPVQNGLALALAPLRRAAARAHLAPGKGGHVSRTIVGGGDSRRRVPLKLKT